MARTETPLPRRRFLSLLGLAAVAAACGRALRTVPTTVVPAPQGVEPATKAPTTAPAPATTSMTPITATTATQPPPATTTTTTTTAPASPTGPPATTTVAAPVALHIEPRSAWGAREPVSGLLIPHSGAMRYLTVHHAGGTSGAQGVERYRIWQDSHIDGRGWGDVAYHYIIHRDGTVYEARDERFRGDTGTDYDPDRHFLVVVEGSFNGNLPTDAQLDSLAVVLAWAVKHFDLSAKAIGGHRDYVAVNCPGDDLYALIADGTIAAQVDAILDAGGVRLG